MWKKLVIWLQEAPGDLITLVVLCPVLLVICVLLGSLMVVLLSIVISVAAPAALGEDRYAEILRQKKNREAQEKPRNGSKPFRIFQSGSKRG